MEQKIRRDRNMGDNLRRLRGEAGLSQEKLCAELQRRGCDIGRTTYAKYEAGELNSNNNPALHRNLCSLFWILPKS